MKHRRSCGIKDRNPEQALIFWPAPYLKQDAVDGPPYGAHPPHTARSAIIVRYNHVKYERGIERAITSGQPARPGLERRVRKVEKRRQRSLDDA